MPLAALLVFLATRICILFFYQAYVTDVAIYFDQATQMLKGLRAYTDFFYPYPPLSLPLIYLPAWFGQTDNFWVYRNFFNKEMFLIDLGVFFLFARYLKHQLKFDSKKQSAALRVYSIVGLFVGHLLYDRIDLGIVLFSLLAVMFSLSLPWLVLISNLGILFKFLPALPAGLMVLVREKKWQRTLVRGLFLFVPAVFVIVFMNGSTHPGLLGYLMEHGERGVQIESVWATPFMLAHLIGSWTGIAETNFGAQHLSGIPEWYVLLSKCLGIAALAFFAWKVWQSKGWNSEKQKSKIVLSGFLIFLATQRVLSPQFFIWLMPWIAIEVSQKGNLMKRALFFTLFALTYIGFDLGYWEFVKFNPLFVGIVAIRNCVLLVVTVLVVRETLRARNES